MVGHHLAHRPITQDPPTVQFASGHHRRTEPVVVAHGRYEATATALPRPGPELGGPSRLIEGRLGSRHKPVARGHPVQPVVVHLEDGVDHSQRVQDPVPHSLTERSPVHQLDDPSQHVGGHGVRPSGPRLVEQRQGGQLVDPLDQGPPGSESVQACTPVQLVHRSPIHDRVADAGGVGEQVGDGDGPLGGHRFRVVCRAAHQYPRVSEGRQEPRQGVPQPEPTLVHQLHDDH